jgi:hypothetical protein
MLSSGWWIKRGHTVQLKTNSGRNRLNILGAYSPDDHDLTSCCERIVAYRDDLTALMTDRFQLFTTP